MATEVIAAYLTFHARGVEFNRSTKLPTVPQVGDRLHFPLNTPIRYWTVSSVLWVCDDEQRGVWHVEIRCTA